MKGSRSRDSNRSKIKILITIDIGFRFDAPLKKFWSFGLLFDQMGFGLIIKMLKIPNQRRIQNSVEVFYENRKLFRLFVFFGKNKHPRCLMCSEYTYAKSSYCLIWSVSFR